MHQNKGCSAIFTYESGDTQGNKIVYVLRKTPMYSQCIMFFFHMAA